MSAPSRLCAVMRCAVPLIQAPMLGASDERLALAVARAGAVGSVPCSSMTLDALAAMLARHRATFAGLSVVYNFFCHPMPAAGGPPEVSDAWLTALAPLFAREAAAPRGDALRAAVAAQCTTHATPAFSRAHLDVLVRGGARAVSFHFGLPPPPLWAEVRAAGLTSVATATTAAEARVLAAAGVDVVVAQGLEAGGHRGLFLADDPLTALPEQLGTFALVPCVRRAVVGDGASPVVVAAGGIADAAGVAAARALGADGVQVGTAFLLCEEAATSPAHRRALHRARDALTPTQLINVLSGRPARGLVTPVVRELGALRADAPPYPYPQCYLNVLRESNRASPDYGPMWCGQNPTGLREGPAAARVRELMGWPS